MYLPARQFHRCANCPLQSLWELLICLCVTALATGCDDGSKIAGSVGATAAGTTPGTVEHDDARLVAQLLNDWGVDLRMPNATGKSVLEMSADCGAIHV